MRFDRVATSFLSIRFLYLYLLGAVHIMRYAFFICLKRDKNKIVVKLTTTKLHKQKKSRVTYYLNSPLCKKYSETLDEWEEMICIVTLILFIN